MEYFNKEEEDFVDDLIKKTKANEFKPKTKLGKFMTKYFYFRGCGNNHNTALHNAHESMRLM